MKTGRNRKIYWDTTCWLAWLNDERDKWSASVMIGLEDVVFEIETDDSILFTSAITRAEIFLSRLDLDKKNKYAKLLRRTNVREIGADPRVMDRASSIREYHNVKGQRVHTPDAIHLATAVLYRADEFHTMDGLEKGGSKKRKLLKLNGDVGGYKLRIVHPYPRNTPPADMVTVRGPLFDEQRKDGSIRTETTEAEPAPAKFQRSGSGRVEGEATEEGREKGQGERRD